MEFTESTAPVLLDKEHQDLLVRNLSVSFESSIRELRGDANRAFRSFLFTDYNVSRLHIFLEKVDTRLVSFLSDTQGISRLDHFFSDVMRKLPSLFKKE